MDRETPLLLPPDLRDWVPADHLVHFVIDASGELDVRTARVNEQGSGSEQYPPAMMLGLLIYSYATGVFGSRRIEQTTFENVALEWILETPAYNPPAVSHPRSSAQSGLKPSAGQSRGRRSPPDQENGHLR